MSEINRIQLSLHLPQVMTRLTHFYVNKELIDLCIHCSNGQIMAHKLVLSSVSLLFKQLLTKDNNCVIIFGDICVEDMKTIIDCIYFGKQFISSNRLQNLINISEKLQIKLISKQITNSVKNSVKSLNKRSLKENIPQKEVQNVFINEDLNDISFEIQLNENPIDLSFGENENKSLITTEDNQKNDSKKRHQKESDLKPNPKIFKCDDNRIIAQQFAEQSNESLKNIIQEIRFNYNNILDSNPSMDQIFAQNDSHLKEISVKTMNETESAVNSSETLNENRLKIKALNELKECLICDNVFENEKQLITHLKKMHRNEDNLFDCKYCSHKSFKFAKNFAQHLNECKTKYLSIQ